MKFFSNIMNLNIKNAVGFLTFKKLEQFKFINHAFSTRLGGISSGNFSTLNLGERNGDTHENVKENIKRFCKAAGFSEDHICFLKQEHSTKVKIVNERNFQDYGEFDGSVTNIKGLVLSTAHADCAPLFFVDEKTRSIGIAHAGWRGTVKNIVRKIIKSMVDQYGSNSNDIICCIGPCIQSCCFEVQEDVGAIFEKINKDLVKLKNGKIFADIVECNKRNLIAAGIKSENIFTSDLCTKCSSDLLFSYRVQGYHHGNMIAAISLV